MPELVLRETKDSIAVLTMNRPEAMNALSMALRAELAAAVRAADADPAVKVIVLTGAGGRAFTAGLDLKELGGTPGALGAANPKSAENDPVLSMEACAKPIIGAVNGVAITGGFEVALACDVLIASANARFADTHARVGILPGWGLSQKLARAIGVMRAKELSLTGNFLDAATAAAWGLVNRVVAPDELMPTALKLAADMASIPAETLAAYKALIDDGYALSGREARRLEAERTSMLNAAVKPEEIEARRAAIQSRGRAQETH
ncbi:MAG: enoyl-CoA hydratase [Alphaproteobacteria bacterium]|jgi:enoyl-CoA hydratase